MSGRERGIFRLIYKHFIASITPKGTEHKLMGEDYYGTKYYEIFEVRRTKKNPSRYFVPVNDYDQELPAEWEAWLRHRRKDPPTMEELETNYKIQLAKKENAAKIEAKYSSMKSEAPKLPTRKGGHVPFPTYEEYTNPDKGSKPKVPTVKDK